MGYHRGLAHRSYRTHKWLEYGLILLGLSTGTPLDWVASHRAHHAFSDRPGDPRSIVVHGFWYAQTGKYFRTYRRLVCIGYALAGLLRLPIAALTSPGSEKDLYRFARDVQNDRFLAWISRPGPYFLGVMITLAVMTIPIYVLAGWSGLLILHVVLIVIFNVGDASDTLSHWIGRTNPGQSHHATDLPWLAWLTMGDGWHAGHHAFPESARHGLRPEQHDPSWQLIALMERRGLAWNVKLPTADEVESMTSGRQI